MEEITGLEGNLAQAMARSRLHGSSLALPRGLRLRFVGSAPSPAWPPSLLFSLTRLTYTPASPSPRWTTTTSTTARTAPSFLRSRRCPSPYLPWPVDPPRTAQAPPPRHGLARPLRGYTTLGRRTRSQSRRPSSPTRLPLRPRRPHTLLHRPKSTPAYTPPCASASPDVRTRRCALRRSSRAGRSRRAGRASRRPARGTRSRLPSVGAAVARLASAVTPSSSSTTTRRRRCRRFRQPRTTARARGAATHRGSLRCRASSPTLPRVASAQQASRRRLLPPCRLTISPTSRPRHVLWRALLPTALSPGPAPHQRPCDIRPHCVAATLPSSRSLPCMSLLPAGARRAEALHNVVRSFEAVRAVRAEGRRRSGLKGLMDGGAEGSGEEGQWW